MGGKSHELSQAIWIARANIAGFREQLITTEDYSGRKMLEYLLAVEEEKLAKLLIDDKA